MVTNFTKIVLSRTVSDINVFLHFTQKFKMVAINGGITIFGKSRQFTAHTLGIKKFVEIALSHNVSEINAFLRFMHKFKMSAKNSGKTMVKSGR